jgi:hypothetical protein
MNTLERAVVVLVTRDVDLRQRQARLPVAFVALTGAGLGFRLRLPILGK